MAAEPARFSSTPVVEQQEVPFADDAAAKKRDARHMRLLGSSWYSNLIMDICVEKAILIVKKVTFLTFHLQI